MAIRKSSKNTSKIVKNQFRIDVKGEIEILGNNILVSSNERNLSFNSVKKVIIHGKQY